MLSISCAKVRAALVFSPDEACWVFLHCVLTNCSSVVRSMHDYGAWRRVAPVRILTGKVLSRNASQNINRLFISGLYGYLAMSLGFEQKKGREDRPGSHLRRSDQMTMIRICLAGSVPSFLRNADFCF
jgi:hypothetical protein